MITAAEIRCLYSWRTRFHRKLIKISAFKVSKLRNLGLKVVLELSKLVLFTHLLLCAEFHLSSFGG